MIDFFFFFFFFFSKLLFLLFFFLIFFFFTKINENNKSLSIEKDSIDPNTTIFVKKCTDLELSVDTLCCKVLVEGTSAAARFATAWECATKRRA